MAGVRDGLSQPKGYQRITQDATTPSALTVPSGASRALIKTETNPLRWKDDTGLAGASAVSAADGMLIDVGDEFWYTGNLKALRIIATVASATVSISYYA